MTVKNFEITIKTILKYITNRKADIFTFSHLYKYPNQKSEESQDKSIKTNISIKNS